MASDLGIPVIMIPDHETAAQMIDAKGWLRISKPFTMATLQKVIERTMGDGSPLSKRLRQRLKRLTLGLEGNRSSPPAA